MSELKPCPFCGGEARYNRKQISQGRVLVGYDCEQCGAAASVFTGPAAIEKSMKISAAKAWNRRAQQPNEPLTLKELPCFEPIYVVPLGSSVGEWSAHWCIYQIDNATAKSDTHKGRMWFLYDTDYGKTWLAYARKPEGSEKP